MRLPSREYKACRSCRARLDWRRFHVAADLAAGTLVELLENYNPGDLEQVHAVYLGGGHVPRRVKVFIHELAASVVRAGLG